MANTITILHISDLHMSNVAATNVLQRSMFRRFNEYIQDWDKNVRVATPDIICCTGDLAQTGSANEYGPDLGKGQPTRKREWTVCSFLESICKLFGLGHDRVCLVPGNHDINRELVNDWSARSELDVIKNKQSLATFFFDNKARIDHRGDVFRRLRPFAKFYSAFLNSRVEKQPDKIVNFLYSPRIFSTTQGFPCVVKIAPICTSWLCQSYYWTHKNDSSFIASDYSEPEGYVAVCLPKIEETLFPDQTSSNEGLRICLMHHPFEWLVGWERTAARNFICRQSDLILTGHVHKNEVYIPQLSHKGHTIGAGALYQDYLHRNSFNIIRIECNGAVPTSANLLKVEWNSTEDRWETAPFNMQLESPHLQLGYQLVDSWLRIPLYGSFPALRSSRTNMLDIRSPQFTYTGSCGLENKGRPSWPSIIVAT
jgi:predicted MPP superfamily phosphohydrolase